MSNATPLKGVGLRAAMVFSPLVLLVTPTFGPPGNWLSSLLSPLTHPMSGLVGMPGYPVEGFFFQAEDGIRVGTVTGVQTCALPILVERDLRLVFAEGLERVFRNAEALARHVVDAPHFRGLGDVDVAEFLGHGRAFYSGPEIGRASCRERV